MVRFFTVLFAFVVALGLLYSQSDAQTGDKEKSEKVRFTTIDGVEISGNFYQGKSNGPVVMMLHAIGQDSRKKGWSALAEDLQASGCSVLTFDFRGHGTSTSVDPDSFWKIQANKSAGKPPYKQSNIEYKDFSPAYYPVLINDIAAAKAFIDRKNDNKVCNSANTILIGSESGATLGAVWLNSEWHRHKLIEVPSGSPFIPASLQPDPRPEGKDVIAAIWLSIGTKVGAKAVRISTTLDLPGKAGATPMVFMYGDADTAGRDIAKGVVKYLKNAKEKDKYRFTDAVEVGKNTKLSGVELLQPSLKSNEEIVRYIKTVVADKGQEQVDKEFRKNKYVWSVPGQPPGATIAAKVNASDTALAFNTYDQFIGK